MGDSSKTKKELIAELEALRAKLRAPADEPPLDGEASGVTRRDLLESAWVAPVVLSVPLAVGALGVSHDAAAQQSPGTTPAPTVAPTTSPTTSPTAGVDQPTQAPPTTGPGPAPTPLPTSVPAPTMGPGPAPTPLPTSAPTASAPPTAFPTAAPGVIPVEISNFDIS